MKDILRDKGLIASAIGFLMAIPPNAWAVYLFFVNSALTNNQVTVLWVINGIAWAWVILPSRVIAKFGNRGEITIED